MRNIKLTIRYDGTEYCGWQTQKNGLAIQAVIEAALKEITGEKVNLKGSGRTDSGVHALAQIASVRIRSKMPLGNIRMALNSILPRDIVIYKAEEASAGFDAQRSAKSKLYRYTIANSNFPDPFLLRYSAKCFHRLDIARMKKAARSLVGTHDFRSFQAVDGSEKNSVRTIRRITIEKDGDLVYIDIEANGFLYNMVRNIAGTLVEIGRGKFHADSVTDILRAKDRRRCGPTMPAKGLCLVKVKY